MKFLARAIWREGNTWDSVRIIEHDEAKFREAVRRCRARYGARELFELEAWRSVDGQIVTLTVKSGED